MYVEYISSCIDTNTLSRFISENIMVLYKNDRNSRIKILLWMFLC